MGYAKIIGKIKNKNINNINIIYGNEIYLIDNIINLTKKQFISESFYDINYLFLNKIDNKIDMFKNFVNTFPFMSEKKVAVVNDAEFLASKRNLDKNQENIISNLIDNFNDTCILFFIIKNNKPDMRKKIVKKIKEVGNIYEINKLDEANLIKWIKSNVEKKGLNINNNNSAFIANLSGYLEYESTICLYDIQNELLKLTSYCINKGEIKKSDIDKLIIKSIESNIFKLVDDICEGKKDESFIILEEMLLNKIPEQYIMHMIIRQYRLLLHYKLLQKKSYNYNEILNKMKLNKYVAYKLSNVSKKLSLEQINNYLEKCLEIDRKVKSGKIDKKIGLQILTNGI